jgi:hypothetical protein
MRQTCLAGQMNGNSEVLVNSSCAVVSKSCGGSVKESRRPAWAISSSIPVPAGTYVASVTRPAVTSMSSVAATESVLPGFGFWSVGPSANNAVNVTPDTPTAVGVLSVRAISTSAPLRSWPRSQRIVRSAAEYEHDPALDVGSSTKEKPVPSAGSMGPIVTLAWLTAFELSFATDASIETKRGSVEVEIEGLAGSWLTTTQILGPAPGATQASAAGLWLAPANATTASAATNPKPHRCRTADPLIPTDGCTPAKHIQSPMGPE